VKTVGFVGTGDDLDISFWRPFGQRRVVHLNVSTDGPEQIKARKITHAVVSGLLLDTAKIPLEDWLAKTQGELVATETATVSVQTGAQKWYIVRFRE
jgi:hypothetical protein